MKKIVYQDLYAFQFLSDVVIAPDGAHAVFVKTWADEENNGYASDLWLLDLQTNACHRLTVSADAKNPFWLDAKTVVFGTKRDKKPEKKSTVWYQIAIDGGEAVPFLEIPEKVTSLKRLHDGAYAAVVSKPCEEGEEEKPNAAREGKDFLIFDHQ